MAALDTGSLIDRRRVTSSMAWTSLFLSTGCQSGVGQPFSTRAARRVLEEIDRTIVRSHYLSGSQTPNWEAWLETATGAATHLERVSGWRDLYFGVLIPTVQALNDSHTYLTPPAWIATSESADSSREIPQDGRELSVPRLDVQPGLWKGDLNSGLGFRMAAQPEGGLVAYGVVKGSPADLHGVEPGSIITSFTFQPRQTQPPVFVADIILPDGTAKAVVYPLQTLGPAPEYAQERRPGGIRYIRFDRFDDDLVGRVLRALAENQSPTVLDLRLNTGGTLPSLKALMGALLGPGREIGQLRKAQVAERVETEQSDAIFTAPLALLTGPGTQSAAEVAADVLKHYQRAPVVGQRTAGQVLASLAYTLKGGAELRVAIQNFIAVSGQSLEQQGVVPTRLVTSSLTDIRADCDPPYDTAVALLLGQ